VTADQAKATALAANPGATVVKAELGDENGVIVYSVELSTGADVKVDAKSGAIWTPIRPAAMPTMAQVIRRRPTRPKSRPR
jgi:peptidase YpeB-like protein